MKNELVSIITPLYNSEKYIEMTILSVLNQTYQNWEMLIIDDCSTDSSSKIVQRYIQQDNRIKYIKLSTNSGAAISRNKGIELAKGKYIAFLDSDDLWKDNKLATQIDFMEKNNYALSFSEYEEIDEKNYKTGILIKVPNKAIGYKEYLLTNPIGCLTAMYNVNIIGKVFMPTLKNREDTAFWLKLFKMGYKGHGIKQSLAYYRIRKGSLSSNKVKLIKFNWHLYRKVENLNLFQSMFYLSTTIFTKIFKIKERKTGNKDPL